MNIRSRSRISRPYPFCTQPPAIRLVSLPTPPLFPNRLSRLIRLPPRCDPPRERPARPPPHPPARALRGQARGQTKTALRFETLERLRETRAVDAAWFAQCVRSPEVIPPLPPRPATATRGSSGRRSRRPHRSRRSVASPASRAPATLRVVPGGGFCLGNWRWPGLSISAPGRVRPGAAALGRRAPLAVICAWAARRSVPPRRARARSIDEIRRRCRRRRRRRRRRRDRSRPACPPTSPRSRPGPSSLLTANGPASGCRGAHPRPRPGQSPARHGHWPARRGAAPERPRAAAA